METITRAYASASPTASRVAPPSCVSVFHCSPFCLLWSASQVALGLVVSAAEASRITALCDTDGDGSISKAEFAALFAAPTGGGRAGSDRSRKAPVDRAGQGGEDSPRAFAPQSPQSGGGNGSGGARECVERVRRELRRLCETGGDDGSERIDAVFRSIDKNGDGDLTR